MSCKDEQWRPDSMILTMLIRAWKNKYVFFFVLRISWWPENLQHSNPSHCAKAVTKSETVTKNALILQQKVQLFLSWQPAQVDTPGVTTVLSKRKLRAHNTMHSVKSLVRRDCFSSDPCGRQQNSSDAITQHAEEHFTMKVKNSLQMVFKSLDSTPLVSVVFFLSHLKKIQGAAKWLWKNSRYLHSSSAGGLETQKGTFQMLISVYTYS